MGGSTTVRGSMKDKQLDKLVKKVTGVTRTEKDKQKRFVDPTLEATKRPEVPEDTDRQFLFKEMKKREF
jgi:hypothetical protein